MDLLLERGHFFSAKVRSHGTFLLVILFKVTVSLISLKRYSNKLDIRAHVSSECVACGIKALGGDRVRKFSLRRKIQSMKHVGFVKTIT